MSWHYRPTVEYTDDGPVYAMREVYYDDEGNVTGWTANPATITGDSLEDLAETIILMRADQRRRPLLDITGGVAHV